MNEPATGKMSPLEMRFAGDDNGNYPHSRFHNEYALMMAMGTVGLKKNEPDKRTFGTIQSRLSWYSALRGQLDGR